MAWTSTNRDAQVTPYTHQAFPKWVTHGPTGEKRIVPSEAAWLALGMGWGHPSEANVPYARVSEPDGGMVLDEAPAVAPKKRGRPRKDAA